VEIVIEEDVSMHEAKKILEDRRKERDLVYDQKICVDYLEKSSKITLAKSRNLVEELSKISILKPRYISLILNMLPDTEEEVDVLFSKERTNLKKEEVKQIVEIVKKFKK